MTTDAGRNDAVCSTIRHIGHNISAGPFDKPDKPIFGGFAGMSIRRWWAGYRPVPSQTTTCTTKAWSSRRVWVMMAYPRWPCDDVKQNGPVAEG
jgi:hypothetical protein